MKKTKKAGWVLLILLFLLIGCTLLSFPLGRYPVSLGDIFRQFGHDLLGLGESPADSIGRVIYNIRLPRILLAITVGAGLSAAGCAYQCVFQNPMASPDVLGASSGAAFGAALAILAGAASGGITLSAFVMSLGSMLIACLIGATGRDKIMTLVLAGMMVSSPLFSRNLLPKTCGRPGKPAAGDHLLADGQPVGRKLEQCADCSDSDCAGVSRSAAAPLAAATADDRRR